MSAFFTAYSVGVCSASVCTSLADDEATAHLNSNYPTGISSPWSLADENTFADGSPHPQPCHDNPDTHRHLLFHC